MNVSVVWASGSYAEWNTTFLSSENGKGVSLSKEFLDLADVARVGVILVRRYYVFDSDEIHMFTRDRLKDEKVLVPPDEVPDIMTLSINGKVALARIEYDDDDKPVVSENGTLCNMLLPGQDVVQGDRLSPTDDDDVASVTDYGSESDSSSAEFDLAGGSTPSTAKPASSEPDAIPAQDDNHESAAGEEAGRDITLESELSEGTVPYDGSSGDLLDGDTSDDFADFGDEDDLDPDPEGVDSILADEDAPTFEDDAVFGDDEYDDFGDEEEGGFF